MELLNKIIKWSNDNSGFVSIIIFVVTVIYGFASGIFGVLRRKPKFKIDLIEGPTFCSTFYTGRKHTNGHEAHITAIALYLNIVNVGAASSSIGDIIVGYHNYTFRYYYLWYWLLDEVVSLSEFQVAIGNSTKIFPFLKQGHSSLPNNTDSFLEIGRGVNGVVYFEQRECWGGFRPRVENGKVKIKVKIKDSFGGSHTKIFYISAVTLEEAKKYNPSFGDTWETLKSK